MRLNAKVASLILSYVALLGFVSAENEAAESSSTVIERPEFTVSFLKLLAQAFVTPNLQSLTGS